jgi:hypothetical protein
VNFFFFLVFPFVSSKAEDMSSSLKVVGLGSGYVSPLIPSQLYCWHDMNFFESFLAVEDEIY